MKIESYVKAKTLIQEIVRWESELLYLNKVKAGSHGDYALRDLRYGNGNTSKIPEEAKQIVLDIVKAHYGSEIFKLRKKLEEL